MQVLPELSELINMMNLNNHIYKIPSTVRLQVPIECDYRTQIVMKESMKHNCDKFDLSQAIKSMFIDNKPRRFQMLPTDSEMRLRWIMTQKYLNDESLDNDVKKQRFIEAKRARHLSWKRSRLYFHQKQIAYQKRVGYKNRISYKNRFNRYQQRIATKGTHGSAIYNS